MLPPAILERPVVFQNPISLLVGSAAQPRKCSTDISLSFVGHCRESDSSINKMNLRHFKAHKGVIDVFANLGASVCDCIKELPASLRFSFSKNPGSTQTETIVSSSLTEVLPEAPWVPATRSYVTNH